MKELKLSYQGLGYETLCLVSSELELKTVC